MERNEHGFTPEQEKEWRAQMRAIFLAAAIVFPTVILILVIVGLIMNHYGL